MSASKFTPGPWKFSIGGTGDFPTWGVHIGRGLVHLPGIEPMEVMDANARLIAAAPELYEALTGVLDWIDNWSPNFLEDPEWPQTYANICAVLAKARGEA